LESAAVAQALTLDDMHDYSNVSTNIKSLKPSRKLKTSPKTAARFMVSADREYSVVYGRGRPRSIHDERKVHDHEGSYKKTGERVIHIHVYLLHA
jgi:hypothetical protein